MDAKNSEASLEEIKNSFGFKKFRNDMGKIKNSMSTTDFEIPGIENMKDVFKSREEYEKFNDAFQNSIKDKIKEANIKQSNCWKNSRFSR